ncbi:WD40-repeat-containing domain protein [Dunaliella salina]|uniref:WD40-repeat-containing domain protein n=1 Tax=Dunaliella salina TaxID=3046 RepID=A0ABQ7G9I5_DUNSA|nr:WD40-repeat-containing domain protein [Dunaliella salina]|eukprot:KAF5831273.1 WD40-repeat-containing domain protein [Dunaliella salina]
MPTRWISEPSVLAGIGRKLPLCVGKGATPWGAVHGGEEAPTTPTSNNLCLSGKEGVSNEDLKPGNVLLDESMHAVLSDFGLSKFISRSRVQFSTQHVRGTDYFLPPEKLNTGMQRMQYSLKADMWSFGILLGQMCSVDPLYPYGSCMTWEDIRSQLVVEKQAPMAPSTPEAPQLQRLIQQCLQLDPNQRPSADEAVQTLEAIQHSLTTPPMSPHTAALQAKEKEVEELRKKLAAVELREEAERKQRAEAERKQRAEAERKQRAEAERKQRAEAERKIREAEQREAQLREQSRAADAKRLAQTAGALPKHALKLLSSPTHTATLLGHTLFVWSVAFTPDGACLVSGSYDSTLKLWDVASGRCTATLEGHIHDVNSVAVSVDGRTAASGSVDRSVKLWDLGSRRCRATLTGHTHFVQCVAFSPDGATMASGSRDYTIRLWDASTGKHKATLIGGAPVYGLAFSADGTRLASGDWGSRVWLWDVRSGNSIAKLEGHSDAVYSVAFSTDGAHVLSGSKDKTIRVKPSRKSMGISSFNSSSSSSSSSGTGCA